MYVEVEPLHGDEALPGDMVWFTTPTGSGLGAWRGGRPCRPGGVHVELTVPVLRWGVDAEPAPGRVPGFARNEIVADVEQVTENGVVVCRVVGSVFMVEFSGAPPLAPGQRLVLRPTLVELYPTGV